MSTLPQSLPLPRTGLISLLRDYAELTKARVTSLIVMSAWCGFYFAALKAGVSSVSWTLFHAMAGIALVAGGTAALNEVMERDLDALMRRTAQRPLPTGRMSLRHALAAGLLMTLGGATYLGLATNPLTGFLALWTSAVYLGAYTPLKRVSTLCTFIGAFPGAMPPVLGWTAIRGGLDWETLVLFGILFCWQFPHFFSIAWLYREDYERARIRMLPVVKPDGRSTARQVVLYSVALVPVSLAPTLWGMAGWVYFAGAALMGVAFLWFGARLARRRLPATAPQSKALARHLLQASVFYLPLLFALMMLNAAAG
jgi:protoheme IX farnesyltransferase